MKHISQRQKGMTVLGIFIILAMLACFFAFGLTAFTLYNESLTVDSAMESVVNAPPAKRNTTKQIRSMFLRNVELNNVERFTDITVKELVTVEKSKDGKKKFLHVKFQSENNLFKNLFLMMKYDKTMELTGSAPQ